ncbi:MAG: fimbrillin family protein [Prevotella sp.]|nr:fimbrillin family protein [Prevotella sp.]
MEKNSLFTACCMVAVMASCSSEDENVNTVMNENQVSFDTYVGMNTRAIDKSSFVEGDVLCINAFQYNGSTVGQEFINNFMQNEALTKTSTGWTYVNSKFWPMNTSDRVSFVASYPNIAPEISGGICSFDFAVNANAASQQDFMWSTITDAHRNDRNGTHQNGVLEIPVTNPLNNVVLHFRHALSRIVFNAKAATYYNGTSITITDIIVNNLYGAGTYSLTSSLGKGEWTMLGEQNNSYIPLSGGTNTVINTYNRTFGTSLLMIPQVLSTTEGRESTVTIKYTVNYVNPSKVVNEERTFNLATAVLKDGNTWEQDKIYNYNFNITLDMITFDAVVDSWSDLESNELTVM